MKISMRKHICTVMTLGVVVLAAGCGGGGQSNAPAVPKTQARTTAGTARARLTLKIPIRKAGKTVKSSRLKPQYVSVKTNGLAIRTGVPGDTGVNIAPWQLFDISATAAPTPLASCTVDATATFRTCVVTVTAPVVPGGTDEFQISATDQAPVAGDTQPLGNFLSSTSFTQTVVGGIVNEISVSLTGLIGQLGTDKPRYTVWAAPGGTANVVVNITANDLAGGAIAGPPAAFSNPIAFTDTLAPTPFTYPSTNPPDASLLPPPALPGPVPATIGYTASTTVPTGLADTVTVSTVVPFYPPLTPPTGPTAAFALDSLVVSAGGVPIASVPTLAVASPDVAVTVNEPGATSFTISGAGAFFTLLDATGVTPLVNPVAADANGSAIFIVHALAASDPATPPAITITDDNGTVATIAAPVAATPGAAAFKRARR